MVLGIWLPKLVGGVKVAVVFPAAEKSAPMDIPSAEPFTFTKSYLNLCLKLLLAGFRVMVTPLPIVTEVALRVGVVALAMVGKVALPETEPLTPQGTEFHAAETVTEAAPSAEWVTVPEISLKVVSPK